MMYAVFPSNLIKRGSKVVLYGAGKVAQNYCKQNRMLDHCEIIFAVDRNVKEDYIVSKVPVKKVEVLFKTSDDGYDYVLISLMDGEERKKVYEYLKENGIKAEKIINPENNIFRWRDEYEDIKIELEVAESNNDYLKLISAKKLFSSRRLDIVARYLMFKDWYNGIENSENESLYKKIVMLRTGGYEMQTYHSGKEKEGIQVYMDNARKMCKSIWEEGFKKEHFIPIDYKYRTSDGLHRLAASLVIGGDVWVHNYGDRLVPSQDVRFDWFKKNEFSTEECLKLLNGYMEIYDINIVKKKGGELYVQRESISKD